MKNLKKGLAVAMSLAMVATVLPTNVMANALGNVTVADAANMEKTVKIMDKLSEIFTEEVIANINSETKVEDIDPSATLLDGAGVTNVATPALTVFDYLANDATDGGIQEVLDTVSKESKFGNFAGKVGADNFKMMNELAGTLLAVVAGATSLVTTTTLTSNAVTVKGIKFQLHTDDETLLKVGDKVVYDTEGDLKAAKAEVPTIVKNLSAAIITLIGEDTDKSQLGTYATNLTAEENEAYTAIVAILQGALEDLEAVYPEEVAGDFAKTAYNAAKAKITGVVKSDLDSTELEKIENFTITSTSKKSAEAAITAVEKLADYDTYANDDKVLELMEALESVIEKAEIVIDANNIKTNEALKAYKAKLSATDLKVAKVILSDDTYASTKTYKDFFEDIDATNADKAIANMTTNLLKVFLDYQEDYSDLFFTATVKEAGKRYVLDLTKEDVYGNNGTYTANLTAENAGIYAPYKNSDKEYTGKSIIEEIIAQIEGKDAAIKAVTTGLKGVTVNNLSSANAAKVVAAEKALEDLGGIDGGIFDEETGKYTSNLTSAEKKTLNAAYKNAKMLIDKMYASGIVAGTAGWVDLGNGNWDFFNEDGTPATKWVAAGKLWYYVKGGHMLRNSWVAQDATGNVWYYVNNAGEMVVNTTIDGYAINANGEWHK